MRNLDHLAAAAGVETSESDLAKAIAICDANPQRAVRRFKWRLGPFGLLRPSITLRWHHVRPLLVWLLSEVLEAYAGDQVEEETA